MSLYDRIVNRDLLIRRLNIATNHVIREADEQKTSDKSLQLDLFADYGDEGFDGQKERKVQEALINIKKRFGKNAILKGTSYAEGATAKERNKQIGGHKA